MRRHVLVSVCSRCCFSGVLAISLTASVSRRLYGIASGGSSRCVFPHSSHSMTRSRYSFVPSFPLSLRLQVPRTWRFPPHSGHGILSEPVKIILPFLKYRVPFSAHTIIPSQSGEQRPVLWTDANRRSQFIRMVIKKGRSVSAPAFPSIRIIPQTVSWRSAQSSFYRNFFRLAYAGRYRPRRSRPLCYRNLFARNPALFLDSFAPCSYKNKFP